MLRVKEGVKRWLRRLGRLGAAGTGDKMKEDVCVADQGIEKQKRNGCRCEALDVAGLDKIRFFFQKKWNSPVSHLFLLSSSLTPFSLWVREDCKSVANLSCHGLKIVPKRTSSSLFTPPCNLSYFQWVFSSESSLLLDTHFFIETEEGSSRGMKQPNKVTHHHSWKVTLAMGGMAGGCVKEQNVTRINKHHTGSATYVLSLGAHHSCILTPCCKKICASTIMSMSSGSIGRCGSELWLTAEWPPHLLSVLCSLASCRAAV